MNIRKRIESLRKEGRSSGEIISNLLKKSFAPQDIARAFSQIGHIALIQPSRDGLKELHVSEYHIGIREGNRIHSFAVNL